MPVTHFEEGISFTQALLVDQFSALRETNKVQCLYVLHPKVFQ